MSMNAKAMATLLGAALLVAPAKAAGTSATDTDPSHAVGADVFFSADAEDSIVVRSGLNLDWLYSGPDKYRGIRLEKAWFKPIGQHWRGRERAYVRAADKVGAWKWNANVGSDGHTVLGAAAIHDETAFRKEFFVEREILETPQGLRRPIYFTFGGVALDVPINDRNVITVVGGLQEFTGDNLRTHLRANVIHVLNPNAGLSLQLRTRYFRNSHPNEYDYYSPRWYVQGVPVLQLRRFSHGWRYVVAGGIGVQRDSASHWRRSSYANGQVTSPARRGWAINGAATFSETPTASGRSYNYFQLNFGLIRAF